MTASPSARTAVPFPATQPPGYEWLTDEPVFDAARHLALEHPVSSITLRELGYGKTDIEPTATPFAASNPFRVLSDEGAAVLLDTCRRLRSHQRRAGNRIENTVRGGCYRSRFLRDLCIDPGLTRHMSTIYGTEVAPHTMPVHLGHLNYEPNELADAVDKWHHDTIPLDFVTMVNDPNELSGGQFEYFLGTKDDMAALADAGEQPPADRIVQPDFPGPGYAIALHGDMVVHRGAPLTAPSERITMVNAYVATDRTRADQSRSRDLIGIDDPVTLYAEWTKHTAWRSIGRLQHLVDTADFGLDRETAAEQLETAISDVRRTIADIRAGEREAEHYER